MKTLFIVLILLFMAPKASSFELAKNDVWYYEYTSDFGIRSLPDKAGHFYRSYFAAQFIDIKYLLIMNIGYEINDEHRGVGFSYRDLIADFLGTISGSLYGGDIMPLVDWNSEEKNIILIVYWRF